MVKYVKISTLWFKADLDIKLPDHDWLPKLTATLWALWLEFNGKASGS